MKRCKCGALIIDAWKTCNHCDPAQRKLTSKKIDVNDLPNPYWEKKVLAESLEQANEIISQYQSFHSYFEEDLKPLQKKWAKLVDKQPRH